MSIRKSLVVMGVAAVSLLAIATASAAGNDYALSAAPQSQFISPGGTAAVSWVAWNNTEAAASCEVSVEEHGSVWSGSIPAGDSVSGQHSIPGLTARNSRLTFILSCGGSQVAKRAVNVKVR